MRTAATFNEFHLGDNLVHLNFLRRAAHANPGVRFVHGALPQHLEALEPLARHVRNLELAPVDVAQALGGVNAWRGAGGWWYCHPQKHDFATVHVEWFAHLSEKLGIESPIKSKADLLFEFPELYAPPGAAGTFDVLLVNSRPLSGQAQGYSAEAFDRLAAQLMARGKSVIATAPNSSGVPTTQDLGNLSVTAIGRLSQSARAIVGVATGPLWLTFNPWNLQAPRILLLDFERVELAPDTTHVFDVAQIPEQLKRRGLL